MTPADRRKLARRAWRRISTYAGLGHGVRWANGHQKRTRACIDAIDKALSEAYTAGYAAAHEYQMQMRVRDEMERKIK